MLFRPAILLFAALALSACAGGPRYAGPDPSFEAPYTLDGGDKLRVTVFGQEQLTENIEAFMKYLRTLKPSTSKGHYIRNVAVGATMTPSVAVSM